MKKLFITNRHLFLLFCMASAIHATAQGDLQVTLIPSSYIGNYNISCHGSSDGNIQTIIQGGIAPYSYQWSNGTYTKNLNNIGAGTYTFTITDANNTTVSVDQVMTEPDVMSLTLIPYINNGGYNISQQGGSDGSISTLVQGGTDGRKYLWNTGSDADALDGLSAGSYSVTVTDGNHCTVTGSATLTEPTPLHIVSMTSPTHHGYNISCIGLKDASIDLTVAGGAIPYTYQWSNGNFTEDIADLQAGEYKVAVIDANNIKVEGLITLTEPAPLVVELSPYQYANGKNVSCYDCSNGSITSTITGGVSPFIYSWSNGRTYANISNLIAKDYGLHVTDANGCGTDAGTTLTQPDRDDWTMNGNYNSNPATQFIGTTDNKDFVFRTNNAERLKIGSNGDVKINSLSNTRQGLVFANATGILTRSQIGIPNPFCSNQGDILPWALGGNNFYSDGDPSSDFLGTCNNSDLIIGTNGNERIRVLANGYVGIGTVAPSAALEVSGSAKISARLAIGTSLPSTSSIYNLFVEGGIATRDVKVLPIGWPDYVLKSDYNLLSIHDLEKFITVNEHLPGLPSAKEIKENDGFELGDMQAKLLQKIEEQTLYIIDLQKQIDELRKNK